MSEPKQWRRGVLALSILGLAASLAPAQTLPETRDSIYGRTTITLPERSDAGDWAGTWFYVSRNTKAVLWFRPQPDGSIKLRYRYERKDRRHEQFSTDWEGHAVIDHPRAQGSFTMRFDQNDADTIRGDWQFKLGNEEQGKLEKASFTMYRINLGRDMVMLLEDQERTMFGGEEPLVHTPAPQVMRFRKASRRQALWGELPF